MSALLLVLRAVSPSLPSHMDLLCTPTAASAYTSPGPHPCVAARYVELKAIR